MREIKIGLMGGTFNPIHNGHLILAEMAKEQYQLDHVVFLPAGAPPHKIGEEIMPESLRMELTGLAVKDNPDFSVSSMEMELSGITYTADTLEKLTACPELLLHGNHSGQLKELLNCACATIRFYFIIGGDSLMQFAYWKTPGKILQNAVILASGRSGITNLGWEYLMKTADSLQGQFGGRISVVQLPEIGVSSTDIRRRLKNHQSIRYLLPEEVRIRLEEAKLY